MRSNSAEKFVESVKDGKLFGGEVEAQ